MGGYAYSYFKNTVLTSLTSFDESHLISDLYKEDSIKNQTSEKRLQGIAHVHEQGEWPLS
jgi:hypothetical protein